MKMMGIMRKTTKDKLADIKQAMKPGYTKKYTDVKSRAVSSPKGKRKPLKGGPGKPSSGPYSPGSFDRQRPVRKPSSPGSFGRRK